MRDIKVAVIFYGKFDFKREKNEKAKQEKIDWVCHHFKKYILEKYDCDVFIHTWKDKSESWHEKIREGYNPKVFIRENGDRLLKQLNTQLKPKSEKGKIYNDCFLKAFCHYYSRYQAVKLCDSYIKKYNMKYTYVLVNQLNILYFGEIEFERLNNKYIYSPYFTAKCGLEQEIFKTQLVLLRKNKIDELEKKGIYLSEEDIQEGGLEKKELWDEKMKDVTPENIYIYLKKNLEPLDILDKKLVYFINLHSFYKKDKIYMTFWENIYFGEILYLQKNENYKKIKMLINDKRDMCFRVEILQESIASFNEQFPDKIITENSIIRMGTNKVLSNEGVTYHYYEDKSNSKKMHLKLPMNDALGKVKKYSPMLYDGFYIGNIENIKIISEAYYYLYHMYRDSFPNFNKVVHPHCFVFFYLLKMKKIHLLRFYMLNYIDFVKIKDLSQDFCDMIYKKCLLSDEFMSENYLSFDRKITPIEHYIKDLLPEYMEVREEENESGISFTRHSVAHWFHGKKYKDNRPGYYFHVGEVFNPEWDFSVNPCTNCKFIRNISNNTKEFLCKGHRTINKNHNEYYISNFYN